MDSVADIKLRLPIDTLVGEYCQLHKKGRQLKCVCPFHNDTHPSMLISPEKGIAYCFACSSGGDIFSFYQKIEGVDFPQALKDLAEKAGVELPKEAAAAPRVSKDEKTRLRECVAAAVAFFAKQLATSQLAKDYLKIRFIPNEWVQTFAIGYSPDSYTALYDSLLKEGFSKTEILNAGLSAQRDLDGKVYDRFRNRLMFPIYDSQGNAVGFGGRTLADDNAKYINSPEGTIYHKSAILYGYHKAKDAIRNQKTVVMVEGYFDVLACHIVGVENVVAVSGTALTEQHVQLLKRTAETVILCLDQDTAGQAAAERAFGMCGEAGLNVRMATLPGKDPADMLENEQELLKNMLTENHIPYIEGRLTQLAAIDTTTIDGKRAVSNTILPLIRALQSSVEREHYLQKLATVLGTTASSLEEDLQQLHSPVRSPVHSSSTEAPVSATFDRVDIVLGTFLMYPHLLELLEQLIEPPENDWRHRLFLALKGQEANGLLQVTDLDLSEEDIDKARIVQLYCEDLGFSEWSDMVAAMHLKTQCKQANQYLLDKRLAENKRKLTEAEKTGNTAERDQLLIDQTTIFKLRQQSLRS